MVNVVQKKGLCFCFSNSCVELYGKLRTGRDACMCVPLVLGEGGRPQHPVCVTKSPDAASNKVYLTLGNYIDT